VSSMTWQKKPKSITCKYLAYRFSLEGPPKYIRLPMVHVYLKSGDKEFTTIGLVDSGSTATFLPCELVEILELSNLQDSSARGAGGVFPTWLAKVDVLKLIKHKEPFDTFQNVRVHIPKQTGAIPYVVLGRDTIFTHFDITFYENKRKMTFIRL